MTEYRDFYHPENQGQYTKKRNQYMFRQGDTVEGIYLILSGQLKRIKEQWTHEEDEEEKVDIVAEEHKTEQEEAHTNTEVSETLKKKIKAKKQKLSIVNELRRDHAKQVVITIVS